ncbi:TRAP transporter permease [Nitratireductor pacificus]|uniref:Sialic acid TRAP transporter permease protein siaT n=1 Tax=Nitratireductor pacificus pht-3B TaxID=391937 RepID=K2MET8_9HYPH|nr:TRAP transporter fused permease subunit [Nitratireductor pacificus]EKF20621.1 Sialic acid TRAP transporter permease protein siaT [Nitratireductor pacificus pht-3B]
MTDIIRDLRDAGWRAILVVFALAMSAYQLVFAWLSYPIGEIHRPLHLMFALCVLFCIRRGDPATPRGRLAQSVWDSALVAATMAGCGYLILNAYSIQERIPYVTDMTSAETFFALLTLFVVFEAARRVVGWGLVIVGLAFVLYALYGHLLPEPLYHRPYSLSRIMESVYLTKEGLWNTPLGVSANYIFIFVLLGALLLATGAGAFFTDIAQQLTGRMVGGTAKTAVLSSSFMGMLQGSSVSNVVTTGSFTIPAMRRSGYSPTFAAGVEAVASSGGQLTPPILGSAAFLMVEFIGVPYLDVIKASIIPAALYYLAVFIMVDLEARRLALQGVTTTEGRVFELLRTQGYLILPPIIMMWFLFDGYTPTMAGFWSVISLMVLTFVLDADNRRNFLRILYQAGVEAPKLIGPVAVACAIGGIIAGVTLTTGLGLKISKIILMVSGGSLPIALSMTLLISIILGMGMPTSGAYIVLAALLAPGLIELGVDQLAAHLFIIFAAASASITPPVAIASYAAAAVANSNPWNTSLVALKLGVSVFIIPFMFVYSAPLLWNGSLLEIAWATVPAAAGIACLSIAVIGHLRGRLRPFERLVLLVAALLFIVPEWKTTLLALLLAGLPVATSLARVRKASGENAA